eukprot:gene1631-2440_t
MGRVLQEWQTSGSSDSVSAGLTSYDECEEQCLAYDMQSFFEREKLTPAGESARHTIRVSVAKVVQAQWPSAAVKCYGSFEYGLSNASSPLDIVVEGCEALGDRFHHLHRPLSEILTVKRIVEQDTEAVLRGCAKDGGLVVNISFFLSDSASAPRRSCARAKTWLKRVPTLAPLVVTVRAIVGRDRINHFSTCHLLHLAAAVVQRREAKASKRHTQAVRDPAQLFVDFLDFYGQAFEPRRACIADGTVVKRAPSLCEPLLIVDLCGINIADTITSDDLRAFR